MEIVLLLVAVVGWLVVRGMDREEAQRRFEQQDAEITRLRNQIADLRQAMGAAPAAAPAAVAEAMPARKPEIVPEEVTIRPASYRPPVAVRLEAAPAPPAPVPPAPVPPAPVAPAPLPPFVAAPAPPAAPRPVAFASEASPAAAVHVAPPPPPFVAAETSSVERRSLEQTVGVNWLNRLGIVLVVFGVAFGLAYEVTHLGAVGKVALSFAISLLLLGGGLWLERMERYRIFARAGIGGGWALGFLTTYAMYFFPATQVLRSQAVDLGLLFCVGVGMVAHSLRYRSQVVTGIAFLLAFSTVTISQVSAFSLLASAVLALGLEFVCVREEWYGLEIAGILAAYGNHFLWLDRTLDAYGGPGHAFPLWGQSTALLILFWAIFRAGYCVRRPSDETGEGMSGLVAVLNSIGVLALMKYQSFHPEYAFRALLALGTVEMVLAFVMRRRRRPAFAVLLVIASVLLIAAIPFRFHGVSWSLVWLLEGEALFVCGILLKERLMRWLGMGAQLLVVGQMLAMHGGVVFAPKADGWVPVAVTFFAAAVVLWVNAEWIGREDEETVELSPYRAVLMVCSFAAALCAVFGLWVMVPGWTLVLLWALLALVLVEAGLRAGSIGLRLQGYGVMVVSLARLVAVNLAEPGTRGLGDLRLWAGLGVLTACAVLHVRLRSAGEAARDEERSGISAIAMWCVSGLAMGLLYLEVPEHWLAVAWAGLALVLLEVGLRERDFWPRLQAYGALGGALAWLVLVNFQSGGQASWSDPRLWAGVGVIVVCLLLYERLVRAGEAVLPVERSMLGGAVMWCASALVSSLLYMELPEQWLAAGWAGFAVILAGAALVRDGARLRGKALLMALMVVARALVVNLAPVYFSGTREWRHLAFFTAVALLAAAVPVGFSLRGKELPEEQRSHWMGVVLHHPEQVFFFATLALLAAWVPVDLHQANLTLGWSGLGVATFVVALAAGERSFRLAGLGLLLLGVAKLLIVDVWGLARTEQIFLLVSVGIALIVVSFLYSKFADRLKEYL